MTNETNGDLVASVASHLMRSLVQGPLAGSASVRKRAVWSIAPTPNTGTYCSRYSTSKGVHYTAAYEEDLYRSMWDCTAEARSGTVDPPAFQGLNHSSRFGGGHRTTGSLAAEIHFGNSSTTATIVTPSKLEPLANAPHSRQWRCCQPQLCS